MNTKKQIIGILLICSSIFTFLFIQKKYTELKSLGQQNSRQENLSGAGQNLDAWYLERSYPFDNIPASKYVEAFEIHQSKMIQRSGDEEGEWESLGPVNIGGRTLCLAFHPTDPDVIFAGSASGGLWKTNTQGVGQDAWEYVPTGFPVLGVASIAIDQTNPDIMYIGTGETYGVGIAEPGTVNRLTRGTYGTGILKTENGGISWTNVLEFEMDEIKGVQKIVIANQNPSEIYAATTDGLYQSLDGGNAWSLIFNQPNCIDVEVDPQNDEVIYVTQGNFNFNLDAALSGIFKSTNKGESFVELLDPGLITAWSGSAKLSFDPNDSNTLYASIQVGWGNVNSTTPAGVYKTTNAGINWTKINEQNIAFYQGWYSHDLAINPANSEEMMYVGVDSWKSTDSGSIFTKKSFWQNWPFGEISVDTPEGNDAYLHGDIHAVYYHPLITDKIFFATDGGVFSSSDAGETFVTHNGGLQTTQFYANMASSSTNPDFCIAGAQDNATYIYKGNPSWWRVIGGDGMSAAVKQDDDQIVFGSSQGLNILKSTNGGDDFFNSRPNLVPNDYTAFSAPFEIAPSDNDIMYAGATYLYKSTEAGANWSITSSQSVDGGNVITNIAISPTDPNHLYLALSPDLFQGSNGAKVFKSVDGGESFSLVNNLPNRVCKDIAFDPINDNIAYAVFSGFGTSHVYKTTNAGADWESIGDELPDVPTNTIVVDPLNSAMVYVGNDLGVYYSEDAGNLWEPFCNELPEAVMIMDLNISPANRKLRIATHGHGIYQRDLLGEPVSVKPDIALNPVLQVYPNPASSIINIDIDLPKNSKAATLEAYNVLGQKVAVLHQGALQTGKHNFTWDQLQNIAPGAYHINLTAAEYFITKSVVIK